MEENEITEGINIDEDTKDEDVVVSVGEITEVDNITSDYFEAEDRIYEDTNNKVIYIIRGLDKRSESNLVR